MDKHMSHSLDSIPLHSGMRGPIFFGQFIHRLTYYFYMFYETKENNRIRHGTFIDIFILIAIITSMASRICDSRFLSLSLSLINQDFIMIR